MTDAVTALVAGLEIGGDEPGRLALAALALTLAAALDGDAGMATAAVSKELRATLHELEGGASDDDAFAAWERDLGIPT